MQTIRADLPALHLVVQANEFFSGLGITIKVPTGWKLEKGDLFSCKNGNRDAFAEVMSIGEIEGKEQVCNIRKY